MLRSGRRSTYMVPPQLSQTQKSLSCFGPPFSESSEKAFELIRPFRAWPIRTPIPAATLLSVSR